MGYYVKNALCRNLRTDTIARAMYVLNAKDNKKGGNNKEGDNNKTAFVSLFVGSRSVLQKITDCLTLTEYKKIIEELYNQIYDDVVTFDGNLSECNKAFKAISMLTVQIEDGIKDKGLTVSLRHMHRDMYQFYLVDKNNFQQNLGGKFSIKQDEYIELAAKMQDYSKYISIEPRQSGGTAKTPQPGGTAKTSQSGGTAKTSQSGGTAKTPQPGGTAKTSQSGGTAKLPSSKSAAAKAQTPIPNIDQAKVKLAAIGKDKFVKQLTAAMKLTAAMNTKIGTTPTESEVTRLHREASLKLHPDRNPGQTKQSEFYSMFNAAFTPGNTIEGRKSFAEFVTCNLTRFTEDEVQVFNSFWELFGKNIGQS